MDCSCFYPFTQELIEIFTEPSVIRQRMPQTFIPSWHSLSFKSQTCWYKCRDDRTEILPFCIRCCHHLSDCLEPDTSRSWTCGDYWRRLTEPPFFDISLYFSLYFSSLQLMTVGTVTAQAWRCFAQSRHHLYLHTNMHPYARLRSLMHTNALSAIGEPQITASCLQAAERSWVKQCGGWGGDDSHVTHFSDLLLSS